MSKDQKKRMETHLSSEVTTLFNTNRIMEKELDNVWEFLNERFNTVRENNGLPLSSRCRTSSKMIPTVSKAYSSNEYITLDRELVVRSPIIKETHHG